MGLCWLLSFLFLAAACGTAGRSVQAGVGYWPGKPLDGSRSGLGTCSSGGAPPLGWGCGWAWGDWVLAGVSPGLWVGSCTEVWP